MYIRIWWKHENEEKSGIVIGPSAEHALAVRTSTGDIVRVGFGEVDKSEWVTDPTAGVSTKPPRGK